MISCSGSFFGNKIHLGLEPTLCSTLIWQMRGGVFPATLDSCQYGFWLLASMDCGGNSELRWNLGGLIWGGFEWAGSQKKRKGKIPWEARSSGFYFILHGRGDKGRKPLRFPLGKDSVTHSIHHNNTTQQTFKNHTVRYLTEKSKKREALKKWGKWDF